jgi:hypothetical protein
MGGIAPLCQRFLGKPHIFAPFLQIVDKYLRQIHILYVKSIALFYIETLDTYIFI